MGRALQLSSSYFGETKGGGIRVSRDCTLDGMGALKKKILDRQTLNTNNSITFFLNLDSV